MDELAARLCAEAQADGYSFDTICPVCGEVSPLHWDDCSWSHATNEGQTFNSEEGDE
jgi:hypothetical protein